MSHVHVLPRMFASAEISALLQEPAVKTHHDEDDGHHIHHGKTLHLPHIAQAIWPHVAVMDLRGQTPYAVDSMMKIYRLTEGQGVVHPHKDEDFDGPDGSRALFSVIVYLNEDFKGGETVFDGSIEAPRSEVGGGLIFPHDLVHEGRPVQSGVKYVLKTDLFVK